MQRRQGAAGSGAIRSGMFWQSNAGVDRSGIAGFDPALQATLGRDWCGWTWFGSALLENIFISNT
jgi:hypothetical protein